MKETHVILVLVHPGSACGSTDFHHGKAYADDERAMLIDRLKTWEGDLVVVDSDLSDELVQYPGLDIAIKDALARAETSGHGARLLAGDDGGDYDAVDWVAEVRSHVVATGATHAIVTGAWYHEDDDHGCVNAVHHALTREGLSVDVDDSAISIDIDRN